MAVDIEVFGQLLPDKPRRWSLEIKAPSTARNLAHEIGLDLSKIGLVVIDGVQSELDDVVKPDSRLCFFPPITGG